MTNPAAKNELGQELWYVILQDNADDICSKRNWDKGSVNEKYKKDYQEIITVSKHLELMAEKDKQIEALNTDNKCLVLEENEWVDKCNQIDKLEAEVKELSAKKSTQPFLDLDGVAVVNLAEPSPGDLERINIAYHNERMKTKSLRAQLEDAKKALEFYGDIKSYRDSERTGNENRIKVYYLDGAGNLARQCLARLEEMGKEK